MRSTTSTRRLLLSLLVGGVLLWSTALAAAPYALGRGPDRRALIAATAVYAAGSIVCHQRADRSFRAWGVKLPVCGRCAGLYAGALLGLLAAVPWVRARPTRAIIAAAAVPTGATLLLELAGVVDPGNPGRAAAAVPLGAAACWLVVGAIRGKVH